MKVITVTNQKGGVGKTVLACHLAIAAAENGKRVLLVDLDTQANATTTLTRDHTLAKTEGGSAVLFNGSEPQPISTALQVDVLHGHQKLDALDTEHDLQSAEPAGCRLRQLPYDIVVIDTPPAIGLRHLGPILWCDTCLTPLEPNAYSVDGLAHTLEALKFARLLNPRIEHHAVINRLVRRSRQHAYYITELSSHLPLAQPYLTLRVAVPDALDAGVPVWRYPRATPGTRAQWRQLCETLIDE